MKVSPADLRRIVETSGIVKSGNAIYETVTLQVKDYGFRSWMRGREIIVVNDYHLDNFEPGPFKNKKFSLSTIEFYRLLKNNFKDDKVIEFNIKGDTVELVGEKDYLEVLLISEDMSITEDLTFRNYSGVEFPSTKTIPEVKYVFRVDSAFLKDIEINTDEVTFHVSDNKLYIYLRGMTYTLRKYIYSELVHGSPSNEDYTLSSSLFEKVFSLLDGTVYLGFLGFDEGVPLPFFVSQREPSRNFKLLYFVSVRGA